MKKNTYRLNPNKMKRVLIKIKILESLRQRKGVSVDAKLITIDDRIHQSYSTVELFDKVAWRNGNQ